MKCSEGHIFDDCGDHCPDCNQEWGAKDERDRCVKIVRNFTDWKWSKHDPYAGSEDGTTFILTEESMEALAKELLQP